jgi:phage major head subunit gpT-like protein
MIISRGGLDALFIGFKTSFNKGFAAAPSYLDQIAMRVQSTTRQETYGWLGSTAAIKEWVGPRVATSLSVSTYSIKNKPFEVTVSVPREDIEDDQIGVFSTTFEMLGRDTKTFPDEQCFGLLASGFAEECYDGQFFFDTDHPVGIEGLTDVISVSNMQAGAGTPWFLIDASKPIKPTIYQERKPFNLVRKDQETDDNVFFNKEYLYGVDGRSNVGFGLWQLAFGSKDTLNATNYASARAAMQSIKSDSGKPLGITPTHMIVPPSLEGAGRDILKSLLGTGGESNKWAGSAELIVTPLIM